MDLKECEDELSYCYSRIYDINQKMISLSSSRRGKWAPEVLEIEQEMDELIQEKSELQQRQRVLQSSIGEEKKRLKQEEERERLNRLQVERDKASQPQQNSCGKSRNRQRDIS